MKAGHYGYGEDVAGDVVHRSHLLGVGGGGCGCGSDCTWRMGEVLVGVDDKFSCSITLWFWLWFNNPQGISRKGCTLIIWKFRFKLFYWWNFSESKPVPRTNSLGKRLTILASWMTNLSKFLIVFTSCALRLLNKDAFEGHFCQTVDIYIFFKGESRLISPLRGDHHQNQNNSLGLLLFAMNCFVYTSFRVCTSKSRYRLHFTTQVMVGLK